jgi:hypothetical protein
VKITTAQKVEDCFDGSAVFVYRFDLPWTSGRVQALRALGELEYFPDFPRPFFRVRTPTGLQVKGVCGESSCRVIFPREGREAVRSAFERHFQE